MNNNLNYTALMNLNLLRNTGSMRKTASLATDSNEFANVVFIKTPRFDKRHRRVTRYSGQLSCNRRANRPVFAGYNYLQAASIRLHANISDHPVEACATSKFKP